MFSLKNNLFGLLERALNIRVWKFDVVDSGGLILWKHLDFLGLSFLICN